MNKAHELPTRIALARICRSGRSSETLPSAGASAVGTSDLGYPCRGALASLPAPFIGAGNGSAALGPYPASAHTKRGRTAREHSANENQGARFA